MPIPSGTATNNKYKVILSNKKSYPYRSSGDAFISKVDVLSTNKMSYISNAPVEFYMNASGVWTKYNDGVTNYYGSCVFRTSTDCSGSGVTNCLGMAVATLDGYTYASNPVRYNLYNS